MDSLSDLLREYQKNGDPLVAERIIEKIAPDLERYILSRIPKKSAKRSNWEDALQETLVAIAETLGAFDGSDTEKFRRWCFAVARYKVADQFRGTKTDVNTVVDPELLREALSNLVSEGLSQVDRADLKEALSLIEKSDPPCLHFLWKRYFVGLSFLLLGDEYEITEEAARKRVERCLALAKKLVRN